MAKFQKIDAEYKMGILLELLAKTEYSKKILDKDDGYWKKMFNEAIKFKSPRELLHSSNEKYKKDFEKLLEEYIEGCEDYNLHNFLDFFDELQ